MSKVSMNLQDSFLNQVRKDGSEVQVKMVDGSELAGQVKGFDNFTVILQTKDAQHLLYKHAIAQLISTKMPLRPENLSGKGNQGAQRPNSGGGRDRNDRDRNRPKATPAPAPKKSEEAFNKIDLSNIDLNKDKPDS